MLQACDVRRCNVNDLVVTRVGGEGTHGLAILCDGEHTVTRSRSLVAGVGFFDSVAQAADRVCQTRAYTRITHCTITVTDSHVRMIVTKETCPVVEITIGVILTTIIIVNTFSCG